MSFAEAETTVDQWLSRNPQTKLVLSDDSDKRMYFEIDGPGNKSLQFFVDFPSSANSKWKVDTDANERDFIDDAKNLCATSENVNIEQILNCVSAASSKDLEHDDGDDDDEDLCDDYNNGNYDDFGDDGDDDESASKAALSVQNQEEFNRYAHLGNPVATKRLLSDMKSLQASKEKFGISGSPREENLYRWDVKLTEFDPKSSLGQDLQAYAKKFHREAAVMLEMNFEDTYPMTPPFVRVVRPKFKFLTGHVTIGGSICMQMLTRSGWSPSNDIESILIQIRSEIMSDGNAHLDLNGDAEYSESEAKDAFRRMVQKYNWN